MHDRWKKGTTGFERPLLLPWPPIVERQLHFRPNFILLAITTVYDLQHCCYSCLPILTLVFDKWFINCTWKNSLKKHQKGGLLASFNVFKTLYRFVVKWLAIMTVHSPIKKTNVLRWVKVSFQNFKAKNYLAAPLNAKRSIKDQQPNWN